jgi:hypothetical protein
MSATAGISNAVCFVSFAGLQEITAAAMLMHKRSFFIMREILG